MENFYTYYKKGVTNKSFITDKITNKDNGTIMFYDRHF